MENEAGESWYRGESIKCKNGSVESFLVFNKEVKSKGI